MKITLCDYELIIGRIYYDTHFHLKLKYLGRDENSIIFENCSHTYCPYRCRPDGTIGFMSIYFNYPRWEQNIFKFGRNNIK